MPRGFVRTGGGRRRGRGGSRSPSSSASLAIATLALTAFDERARAGRRRSSPVCAAARHVRAARAPGAGDRREPARAVAGRAGRRDRRRLPRLRRGRARAPARRAAGERGAARAALAPDHRLLAAGLAWYQLESGALRTLDVGRGRRDGRLLAGRRHGRRDPRPASSRAATSEPRSSSGRPRRRRSSSRSRTCGPDRALSRRGERGRRAPRSWDASPTSARFEQQALARFAADGGNNVVDPGVPLGDASASARATTLESPPCASSSSPTSSAHPDGRRSRLACPRCARSSRSTSAS